ncbi:FAD/NAD-binding domain-containing protein [Fomitiporia mediterranea MF3/22]|uniref:FAD/NAD-binding domain-containing protein n=1 Tax=Fomitiporia mediterranea (strain MF3/22) TaxID=694068 RepID=UPI0004408C7E|nr:FAD/NAD-binding domain-containing protein [Fomitiporia mediterranea MF3/22]EJD06011.1 FAD/NAD-binding domain-containing protein [Fomitiporia mediterranea MF3/22]
MHRAARLLRPLGARLASTDASSTKDKFKILVIGAGTAGISISNQIFNRFKSAGKPLADGDVAIVDAAEWHHYQPGWTLVGAGLKDKSTLRRPLASLVPKHITHVPENVKSFEPRSSSITLASGRTLGYDILVVATGLQVNWNGIKGLSQALADPTSGVSSIYSYDTCDKTWKDIDALRNGKAIFTQPVGVIKCAGAPQKIMNMAWDRYRRTQRSDTIKVEFWTGTPTMFSVKKYSDALDKLRLSRGIHAEFSTNLTSIDTSNRIATFKRADGSDVSTDYSLLHAVPPMGPLDFIKNSPIADQAGWVSVDDATLQHKNPEYANVFAIGDCSSLPTSKTAAAITAQAPVLSENVFSLVDTGKLSNAKYDGYTSCPLLTDYGYLMLAEFKYGLEPKETFASRLGDQATPSRLYYHLKKDFFPWIYFEAMVKGDWYGTNGMMRPTYTK